MKKFASIVCALLMVAGANAMPLKVNAHKAPAAEIVVNEATARKMSATAGDYFLAMYEGETPVAGVYIQTASDNNLAGIYAVGTPYQGLYFKDGKSAANVLQGVLIVDYKSDVAPEEEGGYVQKVYSVKAIGWVTENGNLIEFEGEIKTLAFQQEGAGESMKTTLIEIKDNAPLNIVEVGLNKNLEMNSYEEPVPYWYFYGENENYAAMVCNVCGYIDGVYCSDQIDADNTAIQKNGRSVALKTNGEGGVIGCGVVIVDTQDNVYPDFFLQGKDDTYYHIFLGEGGEGDDAYAYDETSRVSMEFASADADIYDDYLEEYGALYLEAFNDEDQTVQLMFFVDGDEIKAGTYTIDDSEEAGSVLASIGYDAEYGLQPSLAGVVDSKGNFDQVWFIVSGTVTVSYSGKKINIYVDGKNSNGKAVRITIGAPATALEENTIENNANKQMINGQLIIESEGIRYNAQGAIVD